MAQFETFKRQRAPLTTQPAVTIQKRGTLSLNSAAYAALGQPEAVELLYDRVDERIGLRKSEQGVGHAYIVRPLGKGGSNWLISGKAFANFYNIPIGVARRYTAHMEDDVLIVDLKQPSIEVTSNRNPERSLFNS